MIPNLVPLAGSPWAVLPVGQHMATLDEVEQKYATNQHRRQLYDGLVVAAEKLRHAGCPAIYLDGSFVTAKPKPNDYDACWDPSGVQPALLDPLFGRFDNQRADQKAAFGGEFFPSSFVETQSSLAFVNFFQVDRYTGNSKGILMIPLANDPVLLRRSP